MDPNSWQSVTPGYSGLLTQIRMRFERNCSADVYTLSVYEGEGVTGSLLHSQQVNGVFTYSCNEQGKLQALRGFWEFEEGMATFKEVEVA